MNPYEREYFVSRIRSGIWFFELDKLVKVKVITPTVEDELHGNMVYMEVYNDCLKDGIMTQDDIDEWMLEKGLWDEEKEGKIKVIEKDIEKLKVEIYNAANNQSLAETIRKYIRAAEAGLSNLQLEKMSMYSQSCESVAQQEKQGEIFQRCCFIGSDPVDADKIDLRGIYYNWLQSALDESQLRELARNEPWRLHYLLREETSLFANESGRQLSADQKGMMIWSRMYDNIQESMDCPTEQVIEDDDMLDGWFIVQRQKQESERAKSELEAKTNNPKIAQSDEIMVVARSPKERENVENMNTIHGRTVKKQRMDVVKEKGVAKDTDFKDRQIQIGNMQREKFKENFRR